MGRRIPATVLILAALFPVLARASEPAEGLKAMRLEAADLPAAWKLVPAPEDDTHKALKALIEGSRFRKGADYVYEARGLRVDETTYAFFSLSFRSTGLRRGMMHNLRASEPRYEWDWHIFELGKLLFLVMPADAVVANGLQDRVTWKFVAPRIRALEGRFDRSEPGKTGEAEFHLRELLGEFPECTRLRVAAALIYMDRVKPPKPDLAGAQLQACLDLRRYVDLPPERLHRVYRIQARIHLARGEREKAVACLEKTVEPGEAGSRGRARLLSTLAALQLESGDPEGGLRSLEEAVKLEAPFGYNDVLLSAVKDPAFAGVRDHARFRALVKKYSVMDRPIVFLDLRCPKVALEKTRLLVLPPFVVRAGAREKRLEADIEALLKRKVGKDSVLFGKKREILVSEGKDDCSRFLCRHAAQAIIGESCFDLKAYAGGKHAVSEYAERLRELVRAFGIARSAPSHLFATQADLFRDEKGGSTTVVMSSLLYSTSTGRVLVFLRLRRTFEAKLWRKKVPGVIQEIHREMKKKLRKVR